MDQKRRTFLRQTGLLTAGAALRWSIPAQTSAAGSDAVRLGVLGCQRGRLLAREFSQLGAKLVYACDPDPARSAKVKKESHAEQTVTDLRRVLDDRSIDAVLIATPDHWHAPAAILACEAGKHVYVEKPCAHNVREGRLMIEAARRTKRLMQVGCQSRSTTVLQTGIQQLRDGAIGEVLMAKAWNSQRRPNIGHATPSAPPAGFDYDLWVGPAPMRPFQNNCHHYTWHWWYDFGTGDIGNDGIHELDIAAWGLGLRSHPVRVSGHGAKMHFDDDQQFPDTQYVVYNFADEDSRRLLIYEQRTWSPYVQEGHDNGNAFYGTEGYMILAKGAGWQIFGPKNRLIREEKGECSVPQHAANFLAAIRSDAPLNADIELGHRSATLAHLANILAKTGRGEVRFDPKSEQILDDPRTNELLRRTYREGHWAVPRGAQVGQAFEPDCAKLSGLKA